MDYKNVALKKPQQIYKTCLQSNKQLRMILNGRKPGIPQKFIHLSGLSVQVFNFLRAYLLILSICPSLLCELVLYFNCPLSEEITPSSSALASPSGSSPGTSGTLDLTISIQANIHKYYFYLLTAAPVKAFLHSVYLVWFSFPAPVGYGRVPYGVCMGQS